MGITFEPMRHKLRVACIDRNYATVRQHKAVRPSLVSASCCSARIEMKTRRGSSDAVRELLDLAPQTATVEREVSQTELPVAESPWQISSAG